jgi:hypothetical protein
MLRQNPKEVFMLRPLDLSFMEEAEEEPSELLKALPEIRQELAPSPADDDFGLRILLEHPEVLGHARRRDHGWLAGSSTRRMARHAS